MKCLELVAPHDSHERFLVFRMSSYPFGGIYPQIKNHCSSTKIALNTILLFCYPKHSPGCDLGLPNPNLRAILPLLGG